MAGGIETFVQCKWRAKLDPLPTENITRFCPQEFAMNSLGGSSVLRRPKFNSLAISAHERDRKLLLQLRFQLPIKRTQPRAHEIKGESQQLRESGMVI
jgi:hypothetical protein